MDSFASEIAARTIWMEARGDGTEAELAVAWVILNRMKLWHQGMAEVCLAGFQFSCWNAGDPNRRAMAKLDMDDPGLRQARGALFQALAGGRDPTGGATHYCRMDMELPHWTSEATETAQIGHQVFFKDVK